ncbi:MAG: putative Casein kinase I [Streblomastix strix]|uniref:non-specific serine/threonine protein kinase n=1 Tax=Streblomastix strix TaxID=222440 RepID=A0A5J4VF41_9EUKA|nr:MAG: putative Casein kinase I [Streblomastix strix]
MTEKRTSSPMSKVPSIVGGHYKLGEKIGAGSFGDIYRGTLSGTEEEYAIKLEPLNARIPQLMYESKLYKHFAGGSGIPSVKWSGIEGSYSVMVMDLLGSSLEDLSTDAPRNRFTLKTTILLAEQILQRLEYIHNRNYIHRDIKPDNFLMGVGKRKNVVYLIDFGLAKRFIDSNTNIHIPFRTGKGLTGTVRYASINAHKGFEQSRRDDLEAVGYMLIYFLLGQLPWQGLKIENKTAKFRAICDLKTNIPLETLCKGCPNEFVQYLQYVRNLQFEQAPDYFFLRRLFQTLFLRSGFKRNREFDWTTEEDKHEYIQLPNNKTAIIQLTDKEDDPADKIDILPFQEQIIAGDLDTQDIRVSQQLTSSGMKVNTQLNDTSHGDEHIANPHFSPNLNLNATINTLTPTPGSSILASHTLNNSSTPTNLVQSNNAALAQSPQEEIYYSQLHLNNHLLYINMFVPNPNLQNVL